MNNIGKMELLKRWQTSEGQNRRKEILNSLMNNRSIENLSFVENVNGYYDLRGLIFDTKTKLKNVSIANIDFSYSNFNYLILDACTIENVKFELCDCNEMLHIVVILKAVNLLNVSFLMRALGFMVVTIRIFFLRSQVLQVPPFFTLILMDVRLQIVKWMGWIFVALTLKT